jgi:hypothetical protein
MVVDLMEKGEAVAASKRGMQVDGRCLAVVVTSAAAARLGQLLLDHQVDDATVTDRAEWVLAQGIEVKLLAPILTALMSGMTDPAALVLLRGGSKVSAADLTEALTGRFTEHHAFMTRLLLNRIDQHNAAIQQIEQRIEQKINFVHATRDLLTSIPG